MASRFVQYWDGALPPGSPTMCTAEEGKTRQSEAQAADINLTIKKYHLQDVDVMALPPGTFRGMEYGNLIGWPTMQEALNARVNAQGFFDSLPPEMRLKFGNDPGGMLDAWDAGELREVFEELGLIEKAPLAPVGEEAGLQRRTADGRYTTDEPPLGGSK